MITSFPTDRISAVSQWQTYLRVLPTRWRRKPSGIDMNQNYVTVTLFDITHVKVLQYGGAFSVT